MKMFFNGKKITKRKSRQSRKFVFSDKQCREMEYDDARYWSDSLCKGLRIVLSKFNNHTYQFQFEGGSKVIGSVFAVSVKDAREIINNIRQNMDEFMEELPNIKMPLAGYFKKYGMFPHKPQGTAVIISDENASLKQKIKDLEKEIENLRENNVTLSSRLNTIARLASNAETDLEIDD